MATQIKKIMNLYDQPGVLDLLNKFIFSGNPLNEYDEETLYKVNDMIIKIEDDKTFNVYTCVKETTGAFDVNSWHVTNIHSLISKSESSLNVMLDNITQAKLNIGVSEQSAYSKCFKSFVYREATDDVVKGSKSDGFVFI